jgi:hypothetical protein
MVREPYYEWDEARQFNCLVVHPELSEGRAANCDQFSVDLLLQHIVDSHVARFFHTTLLMLIQTKIISDETAAKGSPQRDIEHEPEKQIGADCYRRAERPVFFCGKF